MDAWLAPLGLLVRRIFLNRWVPPRMGVPT